MGSLTHNHFDNYDNWYTFIATIDRNELYGLFAIEVR